MTEEEYDEFRHEAIHALQALNAACQEEFRIGEWDHWDYDFDAGTLIFSHESSPRVIAKIQVVGTTSVRSKSWLWSWANQGLPREVTYRMREVREFGITEQVKSLSEAYLSDDEHLGWAQSSIAAKILNAKGAYRCPSKGGFIYLIFTDIAYVTANTLSTFHAKTAPPDEAGRTVECDSHGSACATYVCEHLVENPLQAWFSEAPSAENPWPDAWCAYCNSIFEEQGEWNEHNEGRTKIKLLCHHCYEDARRKSVHATSPDAKDFPIQ